MMLCGAGLLLSSLTRFEGSLAIAEGQEVPLSAGTFDAGTLYQRRFSKVPQGSLLVYEIGQFLTAEGKYQGIPVATVLYINAGTSDPRWLRVKSMFPTFHGGNALTVNAVGYSPHVVLFDRGGDLIEDFYAVLQLLPAGAEDMFRFDGIIPHTFYIAGRDA